MGGVGCLAAVRVHSHWFLISGFFKATAGSGFFKATAGSIERVVNVVARLQCLSTLCPVISQ